MMVHHLTLTIDHLHILCIKPGRVPLYNRQVFVEGRFDRGAAKPADASAGAHAAACGDEHGGAGVESG